VNKRVAIITGADGGMGYEETKAIAHEGYTTLMACYDPDAAEEKRSKIAEETGNDDVHILSLNLADLGAVKAFSDKIKQQYTHIDLLMNNAGTMEQRLHETVDGLERTVSVNYVGPFLLTRLLLPLMGRGSRIVNMVSSSICIGKLELPYFFQRGRKGGFWRIPVYANTKLALLLFTLELAKRVEKDGITVNAADPGNTNTEIIRFHTCFDKLTDLFFRPFIHTPREGAETAIQLLLAPEKEGLTGTLNKDNHIVPLGRRYIHHPLRQVLWDETEQIVQTFLNP